VEQRVAYSYPFLALVRDIAGWSVHCDLWVMGGRRGEVCEKESVVSSARKGGTRMACGVLLWEKGRKCGCI